MKKSLTCLLTLSATMLACFTNFTYGQTWGNNDERLIPLSHNVVNGMTVENPFTHVIIEGHTMFFTDYYGFNIFNVINPSNPVRMGNTPVPGKATSFTVAGNQAYVCADFGIAIIDISDQGSPQVTHIEFFDYKPYKIIVDGSYGFVAGNDGVRSYSLQEHELVFLNYINIPPSNLLSAGIEKYGNYVYHVNQSNLNVVNVSDPTNMQLGMNISLSPGGSCWGNVLIKENLLFVVSTQRLRIFNLTNPANPNLLYNDYPSSHSMYDIVVDGNYAVVNHNSNSRWTVLDITDPANPINIYMNTDPMMYGLYSLGALKNNILYIMDNGQQNYDGYTIHLVDISVPTIPIQQSTIESEPGKTKRVSVVEKDGNKYALVGQNHSLGSAAGVGSLKILKITDPEAPQVVSEVELPNITISAEAGDENYTFVLMATYVFPNYSYQLGLINIQNIHAPFLMGTAPAGGSLSNIFHNSLSYYDGKLYVASRGDLRIFSVSAGSLTQLGSTSLYGGTVSGIYTNNPNYVYVAGGVSGFLLYNVTNPTTPFMVNFYNTPGSCMDVYADNGMAYVADNDGGLAIFDVSQNLIQPVSQVGSVGNAIAVRVYDGIAYVGLDDGRIEMFDVSNPQQPVSQGWYLTSGPRINSLSLDSNNGQLHVANELEFLILDLEGGTVVVPGDANCDGIVNVMDIITLSNYITGQNPQPFCFENADTNEDGIINVVDMINTVNIILGGN